MLIIGLTGLIGSGKTTVTNLFATLGVPIIDTDLIAHEITSVNGIAMPEIIDEFGDQYLDPNGALLRPKMRKLVFKDCAARKKLESILHPIIFKMVLDKIETIKSKYIIIVVPLLFKSSSYLKLTNRNIYVDCDYEQIVTRLKGRNNFTRDQVDSILSTQVPREKQLLLADDIIFNNCEFSELKQQVITMNEKYLHLK